MLYFKVFDKAVDVFISVRANNNIDWSSDVIPQIHYAMSEIPQISIS